MVYLNSNMLLVIFAIIILIAVIYYLNKNNDQPIPNQGTINNSSNNNNRQLVTNESNDLSDHILNDLVDKYDTKNENSDNVSASDPMVTNHGSFIGYSKKNMNYQCNDDDNNFVHKKKKFTKRTPNDLNDLFDVSKMLPQEIEQGWFDIEPLQSTKQIKGTHLIHPKVHMGVNTVGSSLKNGTHDIRGDIPNPKTTVGPWGNSTMERDNNLKGLCN